MRGLLAGQRFDNISAACQQHFEELVVQWVRNAIRETGLHKIACAGGMFLNVKANKLIRELDEVDEVFFYPAADDGGTPVGAALEAYSRYCESQGIEATRHPLHSFYTGYEWSDDEIGEAIERTEVEDRSEKIEDIEDRIVEHLCKGEIVARFDGPDEWGPRALGNRTIIADARDLEVIRKINFAIKMRDFWMPFAAAVLEEDAGRYLKDARPARYMIEAFDTTEEAGDIVAGLHPFDRTCRPQTVADYNPGWHRILTGFRKETGVSGLLNTSFNLHGYPICGTPEVAINTLLSSGLDALAIGNWWIRRR